MNDFKSCRPTLVAYILHEFFHLEKVSAKENYALGMQSDEKV